MSWNNRIIGSGEEAPDQLLANPMNWRIHPKHQQDALQKVLDEVGWVDDVIVNKRTGFVVDGHLRVTLAMRNDEITVPVKYVDLNDEEEMLVLATFDPVSAMAGTDKDKLDEVLAGIREGHKELLESIGYEDKLCIGNCDPDAVPDMPQVAVTKPGYLYQLGEHRLLCGDCTDESNVKKLIGDEKIDLCMTDPPYGVGWRYETHNDSRNELIEIIKKFFPIIRKISAVVALTPGLKNIALYPESDWILCWFYGAGTGRSPWGFTAWQPILVYGKDPKLAAGEGSHPDGFQFMMSRDDMIENKTLTHSCPKPFTVWTRFMERLTNKKTKNILDPFVGSGTTIIACEQLGRRCFAMEIDPLYCDVAVRRWEEFTGNQAELVHG